MKEYILPLVLAFVMDTIIGDPVFALHPVRLIGNCAESLEKLFRRMPEKLYKAYPQIQAKTMELIAGGLCWFALAFFSGLSAWAIICLAALLGPTARLIAAAFFVWASISPRDLAVHANRVYKALKADLAEGREKEPSLARQAVAMIVGRDTAKLDAKGLARACIESIAESSVDAVSAPVFWALALGPWAAFAYRAINTMDSIFGHKDERYIYFGRIAARADDAANFIPARLSSLFACFLAPIVGGKIKTALKSFFLYRLAHSSPNSGHPEAAYAGALGLRLGGPSFYREGLVNKPWLNPSGGEASPPDIKKAILLMYCQTLFVLLAFSALKMLLIKA